MHFPSENKPTHMAAALLSGLASGPLKAHGSDLPWQYPFGALSTLEEAIVAEGANMQIWQFGVFTVVSEQHKCFQDFPLLLETVLTQAM